MLMILSCLIINSRWLITPCHNAVYMETKSKPIINNDPQQIRAQHEEYNLQDEK